jgi:hypothetical protein
METFEDRLRRFLFNSPNEIFSTILNSISNFTIPGLRKVTEIELYEQALLGAHAVIQTIGEHIYGQYGIAATKFYLTNFVDGDAENAKFSAVADELHKFRNIIAHRWSSRSNYSVGLDISQAKGWWRDDQGLHINPRVFMQCFFDGFRTSSPMWKKPRELEELTCLKRKYRFLCQWLEIEKKTPIERQIQALEESTDLDVAKDWEQKIQRSILKEVGMDSSTA